MNSLIIVCDRTFDLSISDDLGDIPSKIVKAWASLKGFRFYLLVVSDGHAKDKLRMNAIEINFAEEIIVNILFSK